MTRSPRTARRIAAPLAAALVGGTFATLGLAAPAQAAGSQTIDKTFDYSCSVYAGEPGAGIDLRTHTIPIRTQTKLPATAYAGERIAPTPVTLTLNMPELLRGGSSLLGDSADGGSKNASVTLTSNGRSMVKTFSVVGAKTTIPPNPGPDGQWKIPAKGTVPSITVPTYVRSSISADMPARFDVVAKIYSGDAATPTTMDCSIIGDDRALGTIKVVKDTAKPKWAKKSYKLVTKKNKKKAIKVSAKDPRGDAVRYKLVKKTKKGKVTVSKSGKVVFKPKKNFVGKTSFHVGVTDGRTGWVKVKVKVTVKKK